MIILLLHMVMVYLYVRFHISLRNPFSLGSIHFHLPKFQAIHDPILLFTFAHRLLISINLEFVITSGSRCVILLGAG